MIEVIENIKKLNSVHEKEASKLIAYYQSNTARMDYKRYKKTGAGIIGSGAIGICTQDSDTKTDEAVGTAVE